MELLGVLVELGLQLLVLALGGLAPPCVLLGAVLAHQLNVAVAVLVDGVVGDGPEGGHRADAAVAVHGVHRDDAVAAAGQVHARRIASAVDERHGGLAVLAAVADHHVVVVAALGLAARRVHDEQVPHHLRNGVGIHHLVAPVLRAVAATAAVARHGSVDDHHVDDLVVVGQFLVVPVQVVLDAVYVAHVELVLEVCAYGLALLPVALPGEEVAVLLLDVIVNLQLDGVPQRVGVCLRHIGAEVPSLVVQDSQ